MNNTEFHVEFEKAAVEDQRTTVVMLEFINDCERRKSHLDLGYSSVWDYCVRKLEYPSSTACRYIKAARCIRDNTEVFDMLEKNEVNVTSICQFASILDENNKDFILPRVKGASWREVEKVARKFRPPVELRDRMVHVQAATPDGVQDMVFSQFLAPDEYADVFDDVRNLLPNGMGYGDIILTALREYRDRHNPTERQKRREKKGSASLHSHQRESKEHTSDRAAGRDSHQRASDENEAATLHSHQWERADRHKKRSTTVHSHQWESAEVTHDVPKIVRDFIFIRDGGQCTFVAPDGTRCQCRKGLQVDHIQPVANHGPIDTANLRLLCGGHNRLMAERIMGKHVMQPYWRQT
jgi:hypothetical protein